MACKRESVTIVVGIFVATHGVTQFATKQPPKLESSTSPWPSVDVDAQEINVTLSNNTIGHFDPISTGINIMASTNMDWWNRIGRNLYKDGGFKSIRFPGGSFNNNYIRTRDYEKYPYFKHFDFAFGGNGAFYPPTFIGADEIAKICIETGSSLFLGLNFAAFVMYGFDEGLKIALDLIHYFQNSGLRIEYAELGNEDYGVWETPTEKTITGSEYGTILGKLKRSLAENNLSHVKLGATMEYGPWLENIAPTLPGNADWLSYHHYQNDLINGPEKAQWTKDMGPNIVSNINNITNFSAPVFLTEWNLHPFPTDQMVQHGFALAAAEYVADMGSRCGLAGAHFFALADADQTPSLSIAIQQQAGSAEGTPRPVWFAYALIERVLGSRLVNLTQSNSSDVTTHASVFSSGEAGIIVANRGKSAVSICIAGYESINKKSISLARGWIVSPSGSNSMDAMGSNWNGVSSINGIGGPRHISLIDAYEIKNTKDEHCELAFGVPAFSLAGAILYTRSAPMPAGVSSSSLWILFGISAALLFCVLLLCVVRRLCRNSPQSDAAHTLPPWVQDRFSGEIGIAPRVRRSQKQVGWSELFRVRPRYTLFLVLAQAVHICFFVWLFVSAWKATWYEMLYVIAETVGNITGFAYLVCGCFHPKCPQPCLDEEGLHEIGRQEHIAVLQCHYNEPLEDIAMSLRYNLQYFRRYGCSRSNRKYYILDDGFFTGSGDERKIRQANMCRKLREVVFKTLGRDEQINRGLLEKSNNNTEEPLASTEGTFVNDMCRSDCATGFLMWSIGFPEDHVYLVARAKPQVHHGKAGNINNFVWNVLQNQYNGSGSFVEAPPSYVLLLDQDMCLGHEFIESDPSYRDVEIVSQALPWFEQDLQRVAFVQFPQHFYDMDRFDVTFNSNSTFYNGTEIGRGAVGLAAFSGTNCVWDISKLVSIGGIQYGSVTEDSNTSIVAHKAGLRSRYVDAAVAAGNSPQTVEAAIKQVCARWAKGAIDMIFQRCWCSSPPEALCADEYRFPPNGLRDAYGAECYDHFKQGSERNMKRKSGEIMLRFVFAWESMLFPFWGAIAILLILLSLNFLYSLHPPLVLVSVGFKVALCVHVGVKIVEPIIAFPRVKLSDILRSMGAWLSLSITMMTHAVGKSIQDRFCCSSRKMVWTSIRDGSTSVFLPMLTPLVVTGMFVFLIVWRGVVCASEPRYGSQEVCPSAHAGLPGSSGEEYDCAWTWLQVSNEIFEEGGFCKVNEDDNSPGFCACCCGFTGKCGFTHVDESGKLRPAGMPPSCDIASTISAIIGGAVFIALMFPWTYAVFRDLRRLSWPASEDKVVPFEYLLAQVKQGEKSSCVDV